MKRIHGDSPGRCSAVVSDGLVYAVVTDPHEAETVAEQTHNSLRELDRLLAEAGGSKAGLLQAT